MYFSFYPSTFETNPFSGNGLVKNLHLVLLLIKKFEVSPLMLLTWKTLPYDTSYYLTLFING